MFCKCQRKDSSDIWRYKATSDNFFFSKSSNPNTSSIGEIRDDSQFLAHSQSRQSIITLRKRRTLILLFILGVSPICAPIYRWQWSNKQLLLSVLGEGRFYLPVYVFWDKLRHWQSRKVGADGRRRRQCIVWGRNASGPSDGCFLRRETGQWVQLLIYISRFMYEKALIACNELVISFPHNVSVRTPFMVWVLLGGFETRWQWILMQLWHWRCSIEPT